MINSELRRPQILLVPYPAQGHITPMVHLARALHHHGFRPVIVVPDFIHTRMTAAARAESVDDGDIVFAPISGGIEEVEGYPDFFTIDHAMENHMPIHLERLIRSFDGDGDGDHEGVICVVADLLASWAIQVAIGCGIPVVGFWPAMLATYRLIAAIPHMVRDGLISHTGTPNGKVMVDDMLWGKPGLSTEDLPWLVGNPKSQESRFKFWMQIFERSIALNCLLVNTFLEEENEKDVHSILFPPLEQKIPIFQVGPLMGLTRSSWNPSLWEENGSCIEWLAMQSPCSVIYVSFGSMVGPVGKEVTELALGLEATKKPFLWVLRDERRRVHELLPEGFMERVAGHGKVVSWAPQTQVLQHEAVGCFITHCGWNSSMEAIYYGKPLVCYPIVADEFVNCGYIVNVWQIGLRLDCLKQESITHVVKKVMDEGEDIQEKMFELKEEIVKDGYLRGITAGLQGFVNTVKKSLVAR